MRSIFAVNQGQRAGGQEFSIFKVGANVPVYIDSKCRVQTLLLQGGWWAPYDF